jgi:hypothetical protein
MAQTVGNVEGTLRDRKEDADLLLHQGVEQYKTSHFTAALQLWE